MLEHGAVVVVGTVIREAALRCGGTKLIFRMDQTDKAADNASVCGCAKKIYIYM